MESEVDGEISNIESQESVSANHFEESFDRNPGWDDIPELSRDNRKLVEDRISTVVPGIVENAARKRHAIIQTLGCEYLRYRRTLCSKERSFRESIQRTKSKHDVSDSAVYQHISSLRVEEPKELIIYFESLLDQYYANVSNLANELVPPCNKLKKVAKVIADVENVPKLKLSEITLSEVKKDQHGQQDPIIYPGVYREEDEPSSRDHNSKILGKEAKALELHGQLENSSVDKPISLTEDAKVRTKDITNYDTDFSRIYRKIVEAIKSHMVLAGKQKPNPTLSNPGDDNVAVRAKIPFPQSIKNSNDPFARVEVSMWESGSSDVSISTHPLGYIHDENDPCQSGSIEDISESGFHTLMGHTFDIADQADPWYR